MRHQPTAEDIATASAIVARTEVTDRPKFNVTFQKGDWETSWKLGKIYTGWKPDSYCPSCKMKVYDNLRMIAGLNYARTPLPEDRYQARKAICHECPVYHSKTDSCGRLILDAISPQPVDVDGTMVEPCGCVVSLKAAFASEHCPAQRWTR